MGFLIFIIVILAVGGVIWTLVVAMEGHFDGDTSSEYKNKHRGYGAWIYDVAYNSGAGAVDRVRRNLERNEERYRKDES